MQVVGEEDIVADGDGQRVGALENHAHLHTELRQLYVVVDVLAQHFDDAFRAHIAQPLVDAVDTAQQRRFPAPGRPGD